MPVFEVELDDGTKVDIEADRAPTPEEAQELISKTPRVGKAEAFGIGAARSIAPSAAFAAGASVGGPIGMKGGAALGALVPGAGETGISEAVGGLLGAGVGSLALGGGLAAAAEFGQDWLLKKYLPKDAYEKLSAETAAAQAQHPGYSEAGGIAGMLPSFEVAPLKVAQLPFRAALGATVGAVQPLATGRAPTKSDVLGGAAAMTLFGKPRGPFEGLSSLTQKGLGYASGQQKAAEIHGNVQPQPEQGAGQVPSESGSPGVLASPEAVAQATQIPLTDEEQKQWYAERLEDPSLIDKAVKLSTGELAIPLGGKRTSGSSMSIHASPEEAELVAKELRGKPGFEGARVRGDVDENGNVVSHSVAWGRNAQELPTLTDRGRAYGYKESVLFREKMTPEQRAIADIESQKYEEAERAAIAEAEKMGMKATVVDIPPAEEGDENVPWAKGQYMKPTAEGVEINRPAFRG